MTTSWSKSIRPLYDFFFWITQTYKQNHFLSVSLIINILESYIYAASPATKTVKALIHVGLEASRQNKAACLKMILLFFNVPSLSHG